LRIWKLTGNECVDATAHDERHSGQTTVAAEDDEEDEDDDDDDDDDAGGDGVAASRMLLRMSERTQASQKVCEETESDKSVSDSEHRAARDTRHNSRGGTARRPDLESGRDRWST
jgi:hypothetical protein